MKFEDIDIEKLKSTLGYILHTEEQIDNGIWHELGDVVSLRREAAYTMIVYLLKEARDKKIVL